MDSEGIVINIVSMKSDRMYYEAITKDLGLISISGKINVRLLLGDLIHIGELKRMNSGFYTANLERICSIINPMKLSYMMLSAFSATEFLLKRFMAKEDKVSITFYESILSLFRSFATDDNTWMRHYILFELKFLAECGYSFNYKDLKPTDLSDFDCLKRHDEVLQKFFSSKSHDKIISLLRMINSEKCESNVFFDALDVTRYLISNYLEIDLCILPKI